MLAFRPYLNYSNLFCPSQPSTLPPIKRLDILMHFTDGWVGGKSLVNVASEEISNMLE
jgi:hypothetical protein